MSGLEILTIAGIGQLAGHLAEHLGGHILHEKYRELEHHIRQRIPGLAGLPANHDVAHAVRGAELKALERVLREYGEKHKPSLFLDDANRFVRSQLPLFGKMALDAPTTQASIAASGKVMLDALAMSRAAEGGPSQARRQAEDAVLEEIGKELRPALGTKIPIDFESCFRGNEFGVIGWFDAFSQYLAEELKTNERFHKIFITDLLGDLTRIGLDTKEVVQTSFLRFEDKLDRAEAKIDAILRKLCLDPSTIEGQPGMPLQTLKVLLQAFGDEISDDNLDLATVNQLLHRKAEENRTLKDQLRGLVERESARSAQGAQKAIDEGRVNAAGETLHDAVSQASGSPTVIGTNADLHTALARNFPYLITGPLRAWLEEQAAYAEIKTPATAFESEALKARVKGHVIPKTYEDINLWKCIIVNYDKAKRGDRWSQFRLGMGYSRSAHGGDIIGIFFNRGRSGDELRDRERMINEAMKWLEKAAEQGDGDATLALGQLWEGEFGGGLFGLFGRKRKAIQWYEKAAAQGNPSAKERLAELKRP
jgi:TPR repeat protein